MLGIERQRRARHRRSERGGVGGAVLLIFVGFVLAAWVFGWLAPFGFPSP